MIKAIVFNTLLFLPLVQAADLNIKTVDDKKGYQLKASKTCDLHISFGSYGSGTPLKVEKEIRSLLSKQEATTFKSIYSWSWGLEGEYDFCLVLADEKKTDNLYKKLKKLIPEYSRNGYTTLSSKTGNVWKTSWPK